MSLSRRHIDLKFRLGTGSFGDTGDNTASVTGLRVSATIHKAGAAGMNTLEMRVNGLTPDIANQISTLGKPLNAGRNNLVSLSAGSDETGMAVAFIGTIMSAYQDAKSAPDVAVTVLAQTGLLEALRPLPPSSFKGSADVATILAGIAKQMNYTFENSGVSVQLANAYFPGTGRDQAYAAAAAAGINITMDDQPGGTPTLAIWPKTGSRGGEIPLISPDTGMVGYPTHTDTGLFVTTVYNPNIVFGGKVKIQSSIKNANGVWTLYDVTHDLESETPGGKWFTSIGCNFADHAAVAP